MAIRLPFALEGIDHVVLLVRDMAKAQRFYCDVLGCNVKGCYPEYGMVELRAGADSVALVDIADEAGAWARPEVNGGRNLDHFCLSTGPWNEKAMREHLGGNGVDIVEERAEEDELSFYIRDPSGNMVELLRRGA